DSVDPKGHPPDWQWKEDLSYESCILAELYTRRGVNPEYIMRVAPALQQRSALAPGSCSPGSL
ncbi:Glutamate--tRNA ligase, partial [Dissostichus eleginoides]